MAEIPKPKPKRLTQKQKIAKNGGICNQCEVPVQCDNLKRHCFEFHPDMTREYGCLICSKRFMTGVQLRSHMLTHSAKKEACDLCPKVFSRIEHLKVHRRDAHGIVETIFECGICNLSFPNSKSLSRHRYRHNERIRCEKCQRVGSAGFINGKHQR